MAAMRCLASASVALMFALMFRCAQKAKAASTAGTSRSIDIVSHFPHTLRVEKQQQSLPTSCLSVGIHILIRKHTALQPAKRMEVEKTCKDSPGWNSAYLPSAGQKRCWQTPPAACCHSACLAKAQLAGCTGPPRDSLFLPEICRGRRRHFPGLTAEPGKLGQVVWGPALIRQAGRLSMCSGKATMIGSLPAAAAPVSRPKLPALPHAPAPAAG